MIKCISLFTIVLLGLTALAGCSIVGSDTAKADTLKIVTTGFPEYDWVMNILGDNPARAKVSMLYDNGVDPHSFMPNVRDIADISECDVFVYVGGESDSWADDALQEAVNKDMIVVRLFDTLGDSLRLEETVEGMKASVSDDEPEYDEHVWLSLRCAGIMVSDIADAIALADPDNAAIYRANAADYIGKTEDLDGRYEKAVSQAGSSTLLFADRFPFVYLVNDYGLDYYAAFPGCSAETDAGLGTITFLADRINELGLHHVITLEGGDIRLADTIAGCSNVPDIHIVTMDSMQSVSAKDIEDNVTYLSVMENNLNALQEALGTK